MAKGIIYIMKAHTPGLIKIGQTDDFEGRMRQLEKHGYYGNILTRYYAIEVDEYKRKEILLDKIFSKSRVGETELFALDADLVRELLSSFEGTQIYPKDMTKEEVFNDASEKSGLSQIESGIYHLDKKPRGSSIKYHAQMEKKDGQLILLKGSMIIPGEGKGVSPSWKRIRDGLKLKDNILQENLVCDSPSMAAVIVVGHAVNGWNEWKTADGKTIDMFRNGGE